MGQALPYGSWAQCSRNLTDICPKDIKNMYFRLLKEGRKIYIEKKNSY